MITSTAIEHIYQWPQNEEIVFIHPPKEGYNGQLENFYDPNQFHELQTIKDNWEKIRDEILEFEKRQGYVSGSDSPSASNNSVGGDWSFKYIKSFNRQFFRNRKLFPITTSIIDSIPNVVMAAISILPGNTKIAPHFGDTNGIVRGHLGLIVPAPYPEITIKVRDEEMGWEEGKMFCFINVQRHEVWNNTDQRRYVILFDFVPEPLKPRLYEICSKGLASQTHNYFYAHNALYRKMPEWVYESNRFVLRYVWRAILAVQNLFV